MNRTAYHKTTQQSPVISFPSLNTTQTVQSKKFKPRIKMSKLRSQFNAFVKENSRKKNEMKLMPQSINKKFFEALQRNVAGKLPTFSRGPKRSLRRKIVNNKTLYDNPYFRTVLKTKLKSRGNRNSNFSNPNVSSMLSKRSSRKTSTLSKRQSKHCGIKMSRNRGPGQKVFSPQIIRRKEITPPSQRIPRKNKVKRHIISPRKRAILSPKLCIRKKIKPIQDPPVPHKYEVFYRKNEEKPKTRYFRAKESFNKTFETENQARESPIIRTEISERRGIFQNPKMKSTTKILYEYLNDINENTEKSEESKSKGQKESFSLFNLSRKTPASSRSSTSPLNRRKEKSKFHNARRETNSDMSSPESSCSEEGEEDRFYQTNPNPYKDL
ncbi:unnamed protein product [Moneuplotes crassus]|uniref:Uncharacterized protein n=1 Tax=Euplotes crassus TaxID=5936 RepID=A0AAD1TYR6_EUPCR|nr:unnamed protein product [Moneuplotes crassus]